MNEYDTKNQNLSKRMEQRRGALYAMALIGNSHLGRGCGTALVILALLLGMGGCFYLERAGQAQVDQAHSK